MKKHLLTLLLITIVVRGVLLISYPMGGFDDDQSAQRFLISELLHGNLMVGNLRYNTGYPLVIAPVVALARPFGRLDDRIVLLVQVVLASTIPCAMYDVVRTRYNARAALITALVLALDPFGLQWAHFSLPVWLVALCVAWGLWSVNRARLNQKHALQWIAAAGVLFGVACLARWEAALVVGGLGLTFFWLGEFQWRKRLAMFGVLGTISAGVLAVYLAVIHYPSTGMWKPSCMEGLDRILSVRHMSVPITAENGPATARLLNLLTLKPLREGEVTFTGAASYPGWRKPGPWATPEEQTAFFSQPFGIPDTTLTIDFPVNLIYYMGLCPTDTLLTQVVNEAIRAHPVQWASGWLVNAGRMLVKMPLGNNDGYSTINIYLPIYHDFPMDSTGNRLADALGFRKAPTDYFYSGQIVWKPGIRLLSAIYNRWDALYWLALPALVWAVLSRKWLYLASVVMLLPFLLFASAFNTVQPRIYASVYPLSTMLIGGFIAAAFDWLSHRWKTVRIRNPLHSDLDHAT